MRKTIAKDYFMRGVHPEMQIALKSGANFSTRDINALADETVRLELAGITSCGKNNIVSSNKDKCYSSEAMSIYRGKGYRKAASTFSRWSVKFCICR